MILVTQLYNHHHNLVLGYSKNIFLDLLWPKLVHILSARKPLISFLCIDLPFLDILYKWNHKISLLFLLASFISAVF